MASRADYLSKYLSANEGKSSKKKSKGSSSSSKAAQILIEGSGNFGQIKHSEPGTTKQLGSIRSASNDPEHEFEPVRVKLGSVSNPKLGFKRIDNGELVSKNDTVKLNSSTSNVPQTIYRDSSGKIVDLQVKKQEVKLRRERAIEQDLHVQDNLNTGDLDQIKRTEERERLAEATRFDYTKDDKEFVDYMVQKNKFDDPLGRNISISKDARETPMSVTGKPIYTGGPHPENRFHIKAGHFWDGIDRGNGFEERVVRSRSQNHVKKVMDNATQETYTEYDFD